MKIYADNQDAANAAMKRVMEITAEIEVGAIYSGRVERIVDFGAFVNILPGKDGLVHICLLYTSPSPRDRTRSRMPSSA